jgi:hypothetical protein
MDGVIGVGLRGLKTLVISLQCWKHLEIEFQNMLVTLGAHGFGPLVDTWTNGWLRLWLLQDSGWIRQLIHPDGSIEKWVAIGQKFRNQWRTVVS